MFKIITMIFLILSSTAYSAEISEAENNYLTLSGYFERYNNIIFFKRKSDENHLRECLLDLIGKEIMTDYNFVLISPEGVYDQGITGLVRSDRWLKLIGPLDGDSVKNIIGNDTEMLKKWWRTGKLVAATGKIKKYRLTRDAGGNIVELYLDKIKLIDPEKKLEQKPLKK
jgi:hypothetical protein